MTAKKYEYDGRTLSVPQWSKETGLAKDTIGDRIKLGWSIERALTTPPDTQANRPNVGKALHSGILASIHKVWQEQGREAFEKQLGAAFDKDAIATIIKFQNLLPRIVETDKSDSKPTVAIQLNQTLTPEDFNKRFKPLGG